MSSDKEFDRLQRLREQQLRDRDPGDGFRKTQHKLKSRPPRHVFAPR